MISNLPYPPPTHQIRQNNSDQNTLFDLNSLKKIIKVVIIYITCLSLSTVLFIALFHINFVKCTNTFFYNGCIYLMLCSVACSILMFLARRIWPKLIKATDIVCIFFTQTSQLKIARKALCGKG